MAKFPEAGIPTQFKSGPRAAAVGRIGGLVKSDKKKLAAYFKVMKTMGVDKKTLQKMLLKLDNPDISLLDWGKHIESLEEHYTAENDVKSLGNLTYLKERWHKAAHGEKIKTENVHVIVGLTPEEREKTIKRLLDESQS